MNLQETIDYLKNYLEKNLLDVCKEDQLILQNCYNLIYEDIQKLEKENPLEILQNRLEIVNDALFVLNQYFLSGGLSSDRLDFIKYMTEFIYNWNNNVIKNKYIFSSCSLLFQSIVLFKQATNTIEVLQKTIEIYQDLRNWMPPAFDISKLYLDELLKEN